MASQTSAPIHPIPIVGAACALDLHLAVDRRLGVMVQPEVAVGWWENPACSFLDSPVFAPDPVFSLVRVPVPRPGPQPAIENAVYLLKDARTHDMRIVLLCPPPNHGVQGREQRGLSHVSLAVDDLSRRCCPCLWRAVLRGVRCVLKPGKRPRASFPDFVFPAG